jgi:hypothetical protein
MKSKFLRSFVALSFVFIGISSAVAQIPSYVPTSGMISWWGFTNGSPNDATTNVNHFTNYGATPATDRNGTANAALAFNGTNQYMQCSTPSFQFGQTSNFTISFWMNRPAQGYGVALMHGTTTNGNFIWNFQTNTTNGIQYGTNKQGAAWAWAQSAYTVGAWSHLVATFQSGSMTLYINGVQAATATYPHTGAVQTTLPLWLGRGVGGGYFAGSLDDLGIWNRVLTPAEIGSLYAGCDLSITSQPTAFQGTVGTNASFLTTSSSGNATYQWQESNNGAWSNLTNSAPYSGATTSSLGITNLSMALHGRSYRCLVSSGTCGDTTAPAILNVCGNFSIQPTPVSTVLNGSATFGVASDDPNASFTWLTHTGNGWQQASTYPGASGFNTNQLTLSNLPLTWDQARIRCVQQTGNCLDSSSAAVLTVINNIGLDERSTSYIPFPNPSKGSISWKTPLPEPTTARLWNGAGRCVAEELLQAGATRWSPNSLPPGIYTLELAGNVYRFVLLPY